MSLLKKIAKRFDQSKEPELSYERQLPKKDIISVQTFTHSKAFKGFRREKISTYGLDGVERNHRHFAELGNDFANSAIQLMVVKANTETGNCIRIVVDGLFMGNMYRNPRNAESYDRIVAKEIDKVHFHVEGDTYIMLHWPGIGPRVTVQ